MNRPAINEMIPSNQSYYSLVIAIAKRARQIVDEAIDHGESASEDAVSRAVDELARGEYYLIEQKEIGNTIE